MTKETEYTMKKPPYVRGNLYWIKEKGGPVGFQIDEHAGRFAATSTLTGEPKPHTPLMNFLKPKSYDQ